MGFTSGGIAAEMDKFDKLAQGADDAAKKAVKAGGKALAKALSDAAPVRTGALRDSIRAGKVEYSASDGYRCKVAPEGENAQGENLAKIGNILEYGKSTTPPRPWFVPTVEKETDAVIALMTDEIKKAQGG